MLENGKKVVFVGVPMAGKDDAVIKQALQVTKKQYLKETGLKIKDVAFIDNYDVDEKFDNSDGNVSLKYLGRALKRLAIADEAIFGEGWHKARGCFIEMAACLLYNIPSFEVINCKEDDEEAMKKIGEELRSIMLNITEDAKTIFID